MSKPIVPVHVIPREIDHILLGFQPIVCKRINKLKYKVKESTEYKLREQ